MSKINEAPYSQVAVWPGVILNEEDIENFEEQFLNKLKTRVKFFETITTKPDVNKQGEIVPDTGGRQDVFFGVHEEDIMGFAVARLGFGIRWIEDILNNEEARGRSSIYPERVKQYRTW